MKDLRDVDALITGGTSGIGLAIGAELIRRGARPLVIGRSSERLASACRAVPGLDGFCCDVTDPAAVDRIRMELESRGVRLRLLVNNAGVQYPCASDGAPWELPNGADAEIALNVQALVRLSQELLPELNAHGPSALVNVSSGLALAPKSGSPIYCGTKAFVRSYTRALRYRIEDAGLPIHVMEAIPPLVDTPMTEGRGTGKITADAAAAELVRDLVRGRIESRIGKVKLLAAIQRVSPALAYRIMRGS